MQHKTILQVVSFIRFALRVSLELLKYTLMAIMTRKLETRPWLNESFSLKIPNMLSEEEQKLLHYIAREIYTGAGDIVDLGAFLGGSTLCLCEGASRAGLSSYHVQTFDMFRCPTGGFAQLLIKQQQEGLEPGDSVLHLFKKNLGHFVNQLNIYEGDILNQEYTGRSAEILFIDICKTPSINDYVLRNLVAKTTGEGCLILQQDYNTPWLPWIHITSNILRPYLKYICDIQGTRLFLQTRQIPTDAIAKCLMSGTSPSERQEILRSEALLNETEYSKGLVLLSSAWMQFIDSGSGESAKAYLQKYKDELLHIPGILPQYTQMLAGIDRFVNADGYKRYHDEFFASRE